MVDASVSSEGARSHLLDRAEDWCRTLTQPISLIGVLGMLVAAGFTVVDVLLRWIVAGGITGLNEIVAMSFAVAVTACLPSGTARGANLVVDVFAPHFYPRTAAWLSAFGALLLTLFIGLLGWRISVFGSTLADQGRTTVMLGIQQAPFILIAGALLLLTAFIQAIIAANLVRRALTVPAFDKSSGYPTAARTLNVIVAVFLAFLVLVASWGLYDFSSLAAAAQSNVAWALTAIFVVMWIGLLGLVPLAAVLGLTGIFGCALFIGFAPTFSALASETTGFLMNYQVATLPLFLMMGSFAAVAGVAEDLYRLAQALLGSFRGGLAMATIGGCGGFGAVTGSSLATVATFGRVAIPEMKARGYAPQLSFGCVAAGGTLGALIPPSGPLIIFALLTEASIGQLFIGAMVPGLIAIALYLGAIFFAVWINPSIAPPATKMQLGELTLALRSSGPVIILFGTVIGGMYSGVFTSTEAAAVGAFGAFIIALVRGRLRAGEFWRVMGDTTQSTALIYGMIFGVLIFSFFLVMTEMPERMTAFVSSLDVQPMAIILMIVAIYLFLGSMMDSFTVMIVTVPIVTPVILHLGYDMVWWGVINLIVVEVGLITPPFGLHLFVLKSMNPDVSLMTIFRGVLPFCIADFIKLALIISFPILVLWLPSTMFN